MSVPLEHDEEHDGRPRRRPRLLLRALLVVAVLTLVVSGGAVAARVLLTATSAASDYDGAGSGRAVVQVHRGDTAAQIGATLASAGVVKSAAAFRKAASADDRSRSLQPGFYALRTRMSGSAALALLLDPASRLRGRVTIPEGSPLALTLARLAKGSDVPAAALAAAVTSPARFGLPSYAKGRPEGFLFPATYEFEPGTSATAVLAQMTHQFDLQASSLDLSAGARALGRSPYEVVTVASLVEAETPLDADRSKVARVVYNRLAKGMPLQLDSTVNYIRAERAARLSLADISVNSPYNTYKHKGLPPTPINSPGTKALRAALHPAAGDWIYFVTVDKQGHSLFTDSYPEFLAAKAKAQREGVY